MIRRFGRWPFLALLLPALAAALPARASDEAICERAIVDERPARRRAAGGAARRLADRDRAAAERPPAPWPWAINREGQGHWFATREQALAFAMASVAAGRTSFDVGCFQINYRWHGHNFPSVEAMFDQDVNAAYAARFLRALYAERGDWSAAAGAYHSQTPALAGVYRARFERILAGLGAAPLLLASAKPSRQARGPRAGAAPA